MVTGVPIGKSNFGSSFALLHGRVHPEISLKVGPGQIQGTSDSSSVPGPPAPWKSLNALQEVR